MLVVKSYKYFWTVESSLTEELKPLELLSFALKKDIFLSITVLELKYPSSFIFLNDKEEICIGFEKREESEEFCNYIKEKLNE